jgi:hypothetical protein
MAALTKTSPTTDWLSRIDASRTELIEVAKSGNRVASAFAMAEARINLIESLDDEQIKARLLRMTDPRIGMVELANSPTEEDRIRVCAIAILSGFCPGDDQFAVFGGKGGGKLYTKEAGFRTLFAHLGIVPEISTGHPEFVPLGTSGKKVWRVGGKASCDYQGKSYSVEFTGAGALGLPGYESDNVAGITAKARRQILKSLWAKVSPILNTDQADDAPMDLMQADEKPKAIEVTPAVVEPEPTDEQALGKAGFEGWHKRAQTRITDADQLRAVNEYWEAIKDAKNKNELRVLHSDLKNTQVKTLGKNNVDELCRFIVFVQGSVPESEAVQS